MKSKVAVHISNLHKHYKGWLCSKVVKPAVNGVTLNLYQDQIFGLLGHNGRSLNFFFFLFISTELMSL